jgi:hypothetical protein
MSGRASPGMSVAITSAAKHRPLWRLRDRSRRAGHAAGVVGVPGDRSRGQLKMQLLHGAAGDQLHVSRDLLARTRPIHRIGGETGVPHRTVADHCRRRLRCGRSRHASPLILGYASRDPIRPVKQTSPVGGWARAADGCRHLRPQSSRSPAPRPTSRAPLSPAWRAERRDHSGRKPRATRLVRRRARVRRSLEHPERRSRRRRARAPARRRRRAPSPP